jgi:hypothetical protein
MRQAATILIVLATLIVAPSAAADAIFIEQPSLTHAAGAVPGQVTETGAAGPARVFCWNAEAWRSAGWDGLTDGFYDGFNNLPRSICRPLLRSVAGWQPKLIDNRFLLGYAAFILGHEAAHAAGADHDNEDGTPSADCISAGSIRSILRRLGQTLRQARLIERELMDAGVGYEPAQTDACWQLL